MAGHLLAVTLVRAASYAPSAPHNNANWDFLYAAVSAIGLITIVVLVAALWNAHDDRREGSG